MNILQKFFVTVFGGFFDQRLWSTMPGASRSTTAKVDVSEDSALNYSAVWCATRLLCGTGAGLPLPVYKSGKNGDTREKLRNHPVYRLLNVAPNPELTAFNFRSVMWQWQVNYGNAFAEIVREGDNPEAPVDSLWPLHPATMRIVRDDGGNLFYEWKEPGRDPKILEPWRVLHLPSIITYDGLVGRGVIQHARETIGASLAAEKKAANLFGGGGIPAVVVEHPGKWPDEARMAFRKEWKEIYGGPDGDNMALLQGGAVAKPLMAMSEKDSQFLETRQFEIEEIARWYGIPPHLLQHLLRATFNNVEELGIDFVRYGLVSWLEVWEQAVQQKLFTGREQDELFVEHNVDALLRGNAQSRASLYQAMTSAAIMTRNECRKRENLDPVPGGDTYLVQGAMVPLGEDGKPESEFVSGPEPMANTSVTDDQEKDDTPDPLEAVAVKMRAVLSRDLGRMLTKEGNAMTSFSKKPDDFCEKMDVFYQNHRSLVVDAVTATASALGDCGYAIDPMVLAAQWVSDGKNLMLEAAGAATAKELPDAVKRVIDSKTWSERPLKTLERNENATHVV